MLYTSTNHSAVEPQDTALTTSSLVLSVLGVRAREPPTFYSAAALVPEDTGVLMSFGRHNQLEQQQNRPGHYKSGIDSCKTPEGWKVYQGPDSLRKILFQQA
ncbi:hypothetical protein ASPSYDRAFT_1104405 [Aspergillus sydowii CBS 593.65]|uniref:Uncharacterized protein n=1 Tax=Aspergillus sydowii CBS 593.65 TaxID=1036612 RepID=A0A1L9TBU9_9EURO|nr:uncharacterized protein ASPSYDRAFT_1104405 [Aspergillus sydowii CBS 593.65]OJJ56904.1 hypothetical protein ASPSYDRAFT_1104405 [Aspergillus sydowii CBS 593.65]